MHEFQSVFPWTYYADPRANETWPSDPDTLGAVGGKIWTTERWHTAHCLFMSKKLSRALVQGRTTDAEAITRAHADNCVKIILGNTQDWDRISGWIEVDYPPC